MLTFYSFDGDYVRKLAAGDPPVEAHFVEYFRSLLLMKLRFRLGAYQEVEDLIQEVFVRVLRSLRRGAIQHPERLGAFVNSVCNNVAYENLRQRSRTTSLDEDAPERRDPSVDLERDLLADETKLRVRALINSLNPRDRDILKAVFLEERDKDEVCAEFDVDRNYLRVLLHRARRRLRHLMARRETAAGVH